MGKPIGSQRGDLDGSTHGQATPNNTVGHKKVVKWQGPVRRTETYTQKNPKQGLVTYTVSRVTKSWQAPLFATKTSWQVKKTPLCSKSGLAPPACIKNTIKRQLK